MQRRAQSECKELCCLTHPSGSVFTWSQNRWMHSQFSSGMLGSVALSDMEEKRGKGHLGVRCVQQRSFQHARPRVTPPASALAPTLSTYFKTSHETGGAGRLGANGKNLVTVIGVRTGRTEPALLPARRGVGIAAGLKDSRWASTATRECRLGLGGHLAPGTEALDCPSWEAF